MARGRPSTNPWRHLVSRKAAEARLRELLPDAEGLLSEANAGAWAGWYRELALAREKWKSILGRSLSRLSPPEPLRNLARAGVASGPLAVPFSRWQAEVAAFEVLEALANEAAKDTHFADQFRTGEQARFSLAVRALVWARNNKRTLDPVHLALLEVALGVATPIRTESVYPSRKANARTMMRRAAPIVARGAHPNSAIFSLYRES